jgi:hypothetical protein
MRLIRRYRAARRWRRAAQQYQCALLLRRRATRPAGA